MIGHCTILHFLLLSSQKLTSTALILCWPLLNTINTSQCSTLHSIPLFGGIPELATSLSWQINQRGTDRFHSPTLTWPDFAQNSWNLTNFTFWADYPHVQCPHPRIALNVGLLPISPGSQAKLDPLKVPFLVPFLYGECLKGLFRSQKTGHLWTLLYASCDEVNCALVLFFVCPIYILLSLQNRAKEAERGQREIDNIIWNFQ